MTTQRITHAMIFALAIGCVPFPDDPPPDSTFGDGESAFTDGVGDGDTTGDGDGEPTDDEVFTECDAQNMCWVRRGWWGAWAQLLDADDLQAGIDAGTLTPAESVGDAKCWAYGEPAARTCVIEVDGIMLIGRPLVELEITDADPCVPEGPWMESLSTTFWCRVVIDGIAVPARAI